MFLQLPTKDYKTRYALYKLTNYKQQVLHIGVVKLSALTAFEDIKELPKDEDVFMTVLQIDVDRLKLANRALLLCHEKGRDDLKEGVQETVNSWTKPISANAVRCIETGEVFGSAAECAEKHDLTYNALIRHLNGVKSYNSVKKKTYERLGA